MRVFLLLVGVSQKAKAFRGKVWRETVPTRDRATDTAQFRAIPLARSAADGEVCRSFLSAEAGAGFAPETFSVMSTLH